MLWEKNTHTFIVTALWLHTLFYLLRWFSTNLGFLDLLLSSLVVSCSEQRANIAGITAGLQMSKKEPQQATRFPQATAVSHRRWISYWGQRPDFTLRPLSNIHDVFITGNYTTVGRTHSHISVCLGWGGGIQVLHVMSGYIFSLNVGKGWIKIHMTYTYKHIYLCKCVYHI